VLHGKEYGIGRPYLDKDPPHIAPIDGKEYANNRGVMRNSRKRGTLPRAGSQKRLNRIKLFRDGPNLSRFDACGALASARFRSSYRTPRGDEVIE
jgi:hypothetical protein